MSQIMKKCIVFDVDRTIVDSYMPELLSFQEAVYNVTNKHISKEKMEKLTALTTSDSFKYLDLNEEEISLINKEWSKTFANYKTKCFPKIKEVIKYLFNNCYIISIITSRTMNEFHELDEELNDVLEYFKIVITSDLVNNPKPDPESINYLCQELKIKPGDIIYIGDSEIDKAFSINCNMSFIPACWENKELVNEENACLLIDDLIAKID